MKLHHIFSGELPDIDDAVKECINMGQWLLFKAANENKNLFLKSSSNLYKLDEKGKLIESLKEEGNGLEMEEIYFFQDIPMPDSASNCFNAQKNIFQL